MAAWQCRDGRVEPLSDEAVMPPSRLRLPALEDASQGNADWIGIGSGWGLREQMRVEVQAGLSLCLPEVEAEAADMALLAMDALARGEARPAHEVQPVYLRDQVAWQKSR